MIPICIVSPLRQHSLLKYINWVIELKLFEYTFANFSDYNIIYNINKRSSQLIRPVYTSTTGNESKHGNMRTY